MAKENVEAYLDALRPIKDLAKIGIDLVFSNQGEVTKFFYAGEWHIFRRLNKRKVPHP